MAMILITDNPQGGACRCEGQAQALNLANLNPEQVESLKQALGISETAGARQELDINSLLKAEIDPSAFSEVEGAENIKIKNNITSILSDINSLQHKVSTIEQSTLGLDDTLLEMGSDIRDLKHKVKVAPTNKDLQDLIKRVTALENRPATPAPQPPTPPNNDGGSEYIPDWVERVDEFDTTGDEEI